METRSEMFDLKMDLFKKFKEINKEIELYSFGGDIERIFDVFVVSFMSLVIEDSTNRNAMKVHNDFNAYKKYSLTRFKKEYKYLKEYLKDDDFYIKKFTDFFELVNLGDFGKQKTLSRKNLEEALRKLHNTTKNMYEI